MKYKAIIFDLDGTLLDTLGDILSAINQMLVLQKLPCVTYDELKSMIGDGAKKMVERTLKGEKRDILHCVAQYNAIYEKTTQYTVPFQGICHLLDFLQEKNIPKAILSNKPQKDAEAIVARVLGKYTFTNVIGQSEAFPVKPDTKGIYHIVDTFQLSVGDCLYVGDGEMDFVTPHTIAMPVINALWGYRTKEQLAAVGAHTFISAPQELEKYF